MSKRFGWAFGGMLVDKNNKVVIDSAETAKALEYGKELYASFIPGTLEPKQTFITATTVVAASKFVISPLVVFSKYRFVNLPAYRGPPKDGRVLHITNRILRI